MTEWQWDRLYLRRSGSGKGYIATEWQWDRLYSDGVAVGQFFFVLLRCSSASTIAQSSLLILQFITDTTKPGQKMLSGKEKHRFQRINCNFSSYRTNVWTFSLLLCLTFILLTWKIW